MEVYYSCCWCSMMISVLLESTELVKACSTIPIPSGRVEVILFLVTYRYHKDYDMQ